MHENQAQSEDYMCKHNTAMSSEVPALWAAGSSSHIPFQPSLPHPDIGLRPTSTIYPEHEEQLNQWGTTFMTTPAQPSSKRARLAVQTQYRDPQPSDYGHVNEEYDPDL